MPQQLKPSVRARILAAAAEAFARHGYSAARLADIAARADVATGNLYRYYRSKEALFEAVVPRAVAAQLLRLIRQRVRELATRDDWRTATAGRSSKADALLDFWIRQRTVVIILLAGAEESPLAHVRPLIIAELTRLADGYATAQAPDRANGRVPRVVLAQLFTSTADMIVAILREYDDESDIRAAFQAFWRYQLAGLETLLTSP
ncbi:TetR family transcriptional regulator [Salinisphaera sp. PC39]|uniref:TetR/AcrR family transcriptional regulator n=1 Tax=Salinisphaera sp. PC39 TaxID=1304156 RepID=UPI003342D3A2